MIWLIIVLAFFLRLININQSLWLDEASQVLMSQKSIYSIIFERAGDFHPPLSYILFHFWMLLGTTEIWLRLLPIIFAVMTVFTVYKLTKKLFNVKIALIAALLLATAPYHIYYSQEIRMYSMVTFFAVLSMYFLSINKRFGYVLSSLALLYTHYMGVFLILSTIFYILWYEKYQINKFIKLWFYIGLGFLPWIPFLWSQLQNGVKADKYLPGWDSLLSLDPIKAIPLTFIKFSIGRISFEPIILYFVISLLVLTIFGFLVFKAGRSKGSQSILFWLFTPIILTFLISFFLPMNQPFRLLFVLPAFYILIAIGIYQVGVFWKVCLGVILVISLWGLSIYYFNPEFHREDWRTVTKEIPEKAVFAWSTSFDPYIWYGGNGVGVIKHFPATESEVDINMENLKNQKKIYLFEYLQTLSDPNKYIQKWLVENGYIQQTTLNYNGIGQIYEYIK